MQIANKWIGHCAEIAWDIYFGYASVECVERGENPLTFNLLVADESRTDKTICLAVSPSLKAIGVPSRPRLFEAKQAIRLYEAQHHTKISYVVAKPQMALYEKVSAQIYSIYLKYIATQDTANSRLSRANAVDITVEYYSVCTDRENDAYMEKGQYLTVTGRVVRVDPHTQELKLISDGSALVIRFSDIYSIKDPADSIF